MSGRGLTLTGVSIGGASVFAGHNVVALPVAGRVLVAAHTRG